jgi:hypothetical protein
MHRKQEIQQKVRYFTRPHQVFSSCRAAVDPAIVPGTRGIYGWYFDILPPGIPRGNYAIVDGHMLLYIGIAGASLTSRSTLRKRICSNHLGRHSTPQSTLRRTLGALLKNELRLVRHPKAGGKYWFGEKGEADLRQWMMDHALLAWQEDEEPREVEAVILADADFVLPLNKQR